METAVKRLYEGMFLVDSALAAQDWQKVKDEVQRILSRAEAEIVSMKKWDERRLCHEVHGVVRGTYILVYFNCDSEKVNGIERDVQLSELVLRSLILRTDRMSEDDLQKPTPLEALEQESTVDKGSQADADVNANVDSGDAAGDDTPGDQDKTA